MRNTYLEWKVCPDTNGLEDFKTLEVFATRHKEKNFVFIS